VHGPWLLFNTLKDPFQMKNLADDSGSRTLVAEMDQRLSSLMKETGDSWDYRATTGDYKLWVQGEGDTKLEKQDLGVPYPGREDPQPGRKHKRALKHKLNQ
jgi:hypothetical protein